MGFHLETTFKIIAITSFILAPIFFYLWASHFFNKYAAVSSALFYGLAPYHFLDLYVRGDIGEVVSFVFIPLVFLFIEKNLTKPTIKNIILGGLFCSLLILSHNVVSLISFPLYIGYILLNKKNSKRILISNFLILILGLSISFYFWFPALYEAKYVNSSIFVGSFYKQNFASLQSLIYSPWNFGSDINSIHGLSPQIGPLLFLFSVGGLFLIFKHKKAKEKFLFWFIFFVAYLFLSTSLSTSIWEKIDFLRKFQFPWRFIAGASFTAAILSGYSIEWIPNKKIVIILVVIFLITSFSFVKVSGYITHPDSYYLSFPGTTYYHGEATTVWSGGDKSSFPVSRIELIGGKGEIVQLQRLSNKHVFKVNAISRMQILDNTYYFPGWQVIIDGNESPIEFQDMNHRGLITFMVPPGIHTIKIFFKESMVRLIAEIISFLSIFVIIMLSFFKLAWIKLKK